MEKENTKTVSADVSGSNEKTKKNKLKLAIIAIAGAVTVLGLILFFVFSRTGDMLIPVSNDGERWGFINRKGEFVINPQFEYADFFSDGLARVRSGGGRTGYINKRGEFVIPAMFRDGTAFSNGLAFVVSDGGHPTAIDRSGNVRFILTAAEYVSAFSDGLAMFITQDGQHGFVDRNGTVVINPQFARALPFSDGRARIWQNEDVGFIDRTGRIVINPQFSAVGNFNEGKAPFFDGRQWGFINTAGAFVINPQFDAAGQFSERLAPIRQGRSFGFVDRNGRLLINPQFDNASSFSGGLAAVQVSNQWGFINTDGRYEINPQFEEAGDFHNGVALVRAAGRWGIINRRGQYVVNPQFRHVRLKRSADAQPHFVRNQFYDTSEFITTFFNREARNEFDGVSASTTLEELSNHPLYGAGLNARNEHFADFSSRIQVTNDIAVSNIRFHFGTPIFTWVNTYNNWGQRSGRRQQFDFTATPVAIVYQFSLSGRAQEKRDVVASALRSEIERRHGLTMRRMNYLGTGWDVYYLPQTDGRLSFALDVNNVSLIVAFSSEHLHRITHR